MNLEQTEAFCLDNSQHRRLFPAIGAGDYLLTEDELLAVIRVAFKAGVVEGSGVITRMVTDACDSVGHEQ